MHLFMVQVDYRLFGSLLHIDVQVDVWFKLSVQVVWFKLLV
jgi:hypothetical protein